MFAGLVLLLFVAVTSAFHAAVRDSKTVKVSVFYEPMDPAMKDWMNNQFSPHWEQLEEGINIEFVPFGRMNVTILEDDPEQRVVMTCTRGEAECKATKLHACVIKKLHQHKLKMVKVIKCLLNKKDQMEAIGDCLEEIHLRPDAPKFIDCVNSPDTDHLVVQHGTKTMKMFKKLDSLPKIVFNDTIKKKDRHEAQMDFLKTICMGYLTDLCEEKNIRKEITLQL